jgi:hypothetical protein
VVVTESKQYQVEVELLEDTPENLHLSTAVDDGSLPASFHPEPESFPFWESLRTIAMAA